MSRIGMLDTDETSSEVSTLFAATTDMLGRIPNSYRVLAHTPHIAKLLLPFNAALQREGAGSVLATKIKEMVVIKTSQLNGCKY